MAARRIRRPVAPAGSAFNSPAYQEALQGLARLVEQGQDGAPGHSPFIRSNGSALGNAKVQAALSALAQQVEEASKHAQDVGQSPFRRPTGSAMDNPRVEQGVRMLGEMQTQIKQAGVGLSEFKRPSPSNINEETAPQIDKLAQVSTQNGAFYAAHNALNGGEISPEMLARFDQPRYQTGCEKLLNMVPMPQGGITKRPGMLYTGDAGIGGSTATIGRLFPFVFSANESRVLEFYAAGPTGRAQLRIWFPDGSYYNPHIETNALWGYNGQDLDGIQIAQSADVVYIVHRKYRPGKIMRYGDQDWRYERLNLLPSIAAPTNVRLTTDGELSDSDRRKAQVWYDYVVTAIDAETGEESLPSTWTENSHIKTYPLTDGYGVHITWNGVSGASEYHVYKKEAGVFGFIGLTEDTTYTDNNITPDTEDTPPKAKDPFQGNGNYPSVVFLHQQRLGFASTDNHPLTIWLSQAGNYENLSASVPPEDDDGIEVTLAANQANRIVWCQSDRNVLAVGTTGGEWILRGTEDAAITPSDLSFQPQTQHGSQSNSMPAIRAGGNLVYMQRGGRVVREFQYSFTSDKYESGDLGILARHVLQQHSIVHWAWQAEPYGIIWCVLDDGTLAGITYMKEHDVMGWHRHVTDGKVIDITAIPGEDGNTQIWLLVERGGMRYVERMRPFFLGGVPDTQMHLDGRNLATFEARCIPCLPETSLQNGSTFLHVRKINAVKARVIRSMPFAARVGTSKEMQVPVRGAEYTETHADWALPLASGWRENDRLELIFDGPDPVTVLGIVTTVELADMAGGQK